ncbi:MAG: hypothetical protein H6565_08685 [Lewinellaceae bacterium]|nr:hypothetical protein [Lewinellaceae bacterium]
MLRTLLLLCFVIAGMLPAQANGPKQEFTRTINREFGTTVDGMTALYNKYGTVNVKTWQNNSVKIDITIVVNAGSQREADKIFDRIKVNFANTAGYVKAETFIEKSSDWGWNGKSCDFKINYDVSMPMANQLELKNRYGNSYVANLKGKLIAEIKYGDLRTENINNDADISLGYGKAYISKVNNLYGQISYGELTVTEAREVQLDTKYSELKSDRINTLRLTSKYDDFELGTVDELRLQTKYANLRVKNAGSAYVTAQYTDVKLVNLAETADTDLSYGSLKIESVARNFSEVNVVGKYTNVLVATERSVPYRFNLQSQNGDLKTPSGAMFSHKNNTGKSKTVEGYVGDANAKGQIKAKLQNGGVVLK